MSIWRSNPFFSTYGIWSMHTVTERVLSSSWHICCRRSTNIHPLSSRWLGTSLPIPQSMTQAWFRKCRTIWRTCHSAHSSKKRWKPFLHFGVFHSSKGSIMSISPISSHSCGSSEEGRLWEVRMASQPISLSRERRYLKADALTAVPNIPKSWCTQTPCMLRRWPLRKKPSLGRNSAVRMPTCCWVWSTTFPPTITFWTSWYR